MAVEGIVEVPPAAYAARTHRGADARFALALEREVANISFAYRGCYRPRGALTLAERDAYGLREGVCRKNTSPPAPISRSCTLLVDRPVCAGQSLQRNLPQLRKRARALQVKRHRFRVVCAWPAEVRPTRNFAATRTTTAIKRNRGWYRIRVNIDGDSLSCLFFGGRAFVSVGAPRQREDLS